MTAGSATLQRRSIGAAPAWLAAETVFVGAILACLALQLHLVFAQSVNWDEFRFLADVHRHSRGELSEPLQTFHVHLFGWLPWLPFDEIGQVIAARLVMLAVEGGTIALIYRCARHFMPVRAALVAALGYTSFSFVILHGASFRFDPPSMALLMAAALLLLDPQLRVRSMLLAGGATALAGLITIKSAFMLPTLAALALGRLLSSAERRLTAARLSLAAATCLAVFAGLYAYHAAGLTSAGLEAARGLVEHSADKTLGHGGLLPRAETALQAIVGNPVAWLLIGAGLFQAVTLAVRKRGAERARALMLLAFALPLLTPLFYRNAYPYYYAWIMAPAALFAGAGTLRLARSGRATVITLLLVNAVLVYHQRATATAPILAAQRATVAAVHAIFPAPVAYIDRTSMIGGFRKVGPFMSSWGMENYRAGGRPIMRELLLASAPPLLIANSPVLESALLARAMPGNGLLPPDAAILRANFIPHWGALWVAGKTLELDATPRGFEMVVPGLYTVESSAPVLLDGVLRRSGEVVRLAAGPHRIASAQGGQTVRLRWGNHLARPAGAPPAHPLFAGLI